MKKPPRGLFITGTDTEVGKTYVARLIVKSLADRGHRVGVYKPVASDCVLMGEQLVAEDAIVLWEAAGRPLDLDSVCPQRFRATTAPHLAAKSEGKSIQTDLLRQGLEAWEGHCDIVVIEGAGGLMCPVSEDEFVADLALDFGYPMIVVAPNVLGVINQTLQTLITAACYRDGLDVAGIVLNDSQNLIDDQSIETNQAEIASRAIPPVLTRVSYAAERFEQEIDWFALACNVDPQNNVNEHNDANKPNDATQKNGATRQVLENTPIKQQA